MQSYPYSTPAYTWGDSSDQSSQSSPLTPYSPFSYGDDFTRPITTIDPRLTIGSSPDQGMGGSSHSGIYPPSEDETPVDINMTINAYASLELRSPHHFLRGPVGMPVGGGSQVRQGPVLYGVAQERVPCLPQIPESTPTSGSARPSHRGSTSSTRHFSQSTLILPSVTKGFRPLITSQATRTAADKIAKRKAKFSCPYCDQSLTTKPGLQNHINSHFNIRKFICGTCSRGFITKWDCHRHETSQHHSAI